jgi:SAM-dependent methyltransferase
MPLTEEKLDEIAEAYHGQDALGDKFIEDLAQHHTLDWIDEQMAGGESVLELGYGEGNITRALVERGYCLTVLEGSGILLEKARAVHGDRIIARHGLFEDFVADKPYDRILATHVLEHVDDPVELLNHIKKSLAPDGKIIIIVPNKESLHRQLSVIMGLQPTLDTLGERDKLVGHQRVYSLETLEKDVAAAGLRPVATAGFFLKTVPNSMMSDYSPELLAALNKISPSLPERLMANIGLSCSPA